MWRKGGKEGDFVGRGRFSEGGEGSCKLESFEFGG